MKREDIRIRDPFVLPYQGKYYLYGTGTPGAEDINQGRQFWCYISEDLGNIFLTSYLSKTVVTA